jgi:AraC-like DNA-binding protein
MAIPAVPVERLADSSDPLGEALHFLRMTGAFYCRTELRAPCGLELPPMGDCLAFHAVVSGDCWLGVDSGESVMLTTGDLALVPHGRGHRLATAAGVDTPNIFDLPHEYLSERYAVLRHGDGDDDPVELVCGAVEFDHPAATNLMAVLPAVIHIQATSSPETAALHTMVQVMGAEAKRLRPGGETIVTRLCDVVVIQAIRSWLDNDPAAHLGWLGALRDEHVGAAIAAIHRHPERDWTVASLAAESLMSRSAFAARFTQLAGEPAMRYVGRWRMGVAVDRLRDGATSISEVAAGLGYDSEASFSRAFKRICGYPPSEARDRDRPPRNK